MKAIKRTIRKFFGGGETPKAQVEVYVRSDQGETFYVPTLQEGIHHLLSNEGYRLGVYEDIHKDGSFQRYAIVVFRGGSNLGLRLDAPMLNYRSELNEIEFDPDYSPDTRFEQPTVILVPTEMSVSELGVQGTEVTIDGS